MIGGAGPSLTANESSRRMNRAQLVVAGDSTVGKSSICQVFHSDGSQFPKAYSMTTSVDLLTKYMNSASGAGAVELFLYDCAGKEIFSEIVVKCWEQPRLMMIVYDITDETSFSGCAKWIERVRKANSQGNLIGVLVGNKSDLNDRRAVSEEAGKDLAKTHGLEYFEVSAKNLDVSKPFQYLVDEFDRVMLDQEEQAKEQ